MWRQLPVAGPGPLQGPWPTKWVRVPGSPAGNTNTTHREGPWEEPRQHKAREEQKKGAFGEGRGAEPPPYPSEGLFLACSTFEHTKKTANNMPCF